LAAGKRRREVRDLSRSKIFHLGKLPVDTQISGYYNVIRPDTGVNWQVRAQVQLTFPK